MKASVYRVEHFNAAHRLHNPKWTDEQNKIIFDKCNSPNYHGHNYKLIVRVSGEVNPDTGYVIDAKNLSEIITKNIVDRFDHKNLNLDVEEFKTLIPTIENIVVVIYNILRKKIDQKFEIKVTLYETDRNYTEYP
jgi:6-pyruvoyltetrahydropterin/6-carboxytetrahydropterin synthase